MIADFKDIRADSILDRDRCTEFSLGRVVNTAFFGSLQECLDVELTAGQNALKICSLSFFANCEVRPQSDFLRSPAPHAL